MKKILFLIFVVLLLYAAILFAPIGIFLFQASSLEFSDDALYEQLAALTSVIVIEDVGTTEAQPSPQSIIVTLSEEDLEDILTRAFRKQENAFIHVNLVRTEISPDLIELEIFYQYGWRDYRLFEATIFSRWLVDIFPPLSESEKSSRIGIMPVEMHTNHLYSVNLAQLWPYLVNTTRENPWLILLGDAQFQIEDLTLLEHELALSLIW